MKPRFRIEAGISWLLIKERRRNLFGIPYYKTIQKIWNGDEILALSTAGRYLDRYVEIDAKHNGNTNSTKLP
jgi:hypothetical protein